MSLKPVRITSSELLTPLGNDLTATWLAIRQGRRVGNAGPIAPASITPYETLLGPLLTESGRQLWCGEQLEPAQRYALIVASATLAKSGWTREQWQDETTLCVVATSKGSIVSWLNAREGGDVAAMRKIISIPDPAAELCTMGLASTDVILGQALGLRGPRKTIIGACASGLMAVHHAVGMLQHGCARRALVVASDASLHPLFLAAYRRLGVLAPPDADGQARCDPFAASGKGFVVSEAAAAVTLEVDSEPQAGIFLSRTGLASDGTHLVATDPSDYALRRLLQRLYEPEAPLGFVHAHATGTGHDAYELQAIRDTYGADKPVFSHKYYLGHTMGAASLVSLVLSAQCHRTGLLLDGTPFDPTRPSVTLAQGFGGHIAGAVLQSRTAP